MTGIKTPVAQFEIFFHQFLDPKGNPTEKFPAFATDEHLIQLYSAMVRNRSFDTKAITLQRTGKLGTYPSTLGQEAVGIGVGAAMQKTDVLCPYYRECGGQFLRGVAMREILLYWGGDERGSQFVNQAHDFPICVPIASQTLHAVGAAVAFKLKKESRAVVTLVGDGGTSRGDFYEAMNLAGAWKLPVVFLINNNQWAISVPRTEQTAAKTLAQKGIAAGLYCEQVDGNDVIAVQHSLHLALERARRGEPSVIEALTYRLSDHTTADDARRYRKEEELKQFQLEDPIYRLNQYLIHQNLWDEAKDKALKLAAGEEVATAVQDYLKIEARKPESMFDHLYANLPDCYLPEREEVSRLELKPHE
jgi:2-oxoisovalerate dehydrogenase E1 component alpha subunit